MTTGHLPDDIFFFYLHIKHNNKQVFIDITGRKTVFC